MRVDDYSDFGEAVSPRPSIIYFPIPKLYIKGIYGRAFRAPTFQELSDWTNIGPDGTLGNENLEEEKAANYSIETGYFTVPCATSGPAARGSRASPSGHLAASCRRAARGARGPPGPRS